MTYPQQPYGGQEPHGQPGYGGYDPSAQYPPAQYPSAQYGGGFGGYGPPPPRKKTGAIVAVVAVVALVLGGLAFTGFVAPGFLLGDGDDTAGGGGPTTTTTTSSSAPAGDDPEDVLDTLVDALAGQDADALEDLACESPDLTVRTIIEAADRIDDAELVDHEEGSADEVMATVEVTTATGTSELEVTITRDDGAWCWQDGELLGGEDPSEPSEPSEPSTGPSEPGTPTADGKPVDPKALAAMEKFLDSINAGNAAAAKGQLCRDAISTAEDIDELISYQPNLRIDPAMDGIASERSVQLYLVGTAKGQELEGYSTNLWVSGYEGPWCVHAFRAVVI